MEDVRYQLNTLSLQERCASKSMWYWLRLVIGKLLPPSRNLHKWNSDLGVLILCYDVLGRILDKIINDKDYSLVFRVFELMKWVSEDPSYVTGGEPKYPQELFSAVDLLFLQFLGQRATTLCSKISPNSFLSSILLVVVIIVTVVIIMIILIVVVVAIVGVVIVVAIFGVVVVFDGWAYAFHQDKASLVRVPVENVTLSFSAHLLRENTDSVRSNQRMREISLGTIVPIGIVGSLPMVALVLPGGRFPDLFGDDAGISFNDLIMIGILYVVSKGNLILLP
ncbi:hypothetical protein Tco_1129750 [Tanacetum coccineum]